MGCGVKGKSNVIQHIRTHSTQCEANAAHDTKTRSTRTQTHAAHAAHAYAATASTDDMQAHATNAQTQHTHISRNTCLARAARARAALACVLSVC